MLRVSSFYGWRLLAALAAIASVNQGMTYLGAGVINAPMARNLGLSRGILGLGSTFFVLCIGLSAPLVGGLVNAFGSRLCLVFGSLLVALGAILLATGASQGWHFVVCYGLLLGMGCGFGSMIPAQSCASLWFERRRATALGLVLVGTGVGGAISAPLLTHVIVTAHGNWRAGWWCVSAAAFLAGMVSIAFVKDSPDDLGQVPDGQEKLVGEIADDAAARHSRVYRTRDHWTVREAVRTPAFWLLTLAAVGESVPGTAAVAHAIPHLRDLGHTAEAAGSALGIFSVCSILGSLIVGFFCDRMDPRIAWAVSIVIIGSSLLIATRAESNVGMYLFTGMLGFGSGSALTCWHATVANYFGPASFPSILCAQMPISTTIAAASPFLVGVAYDVHGTYTPAFLAVSALSVSTAILLLVAGPPMHTVRTDPSRLMANS
ncbi:Major Facilitator Superfamily protein [Bryocella elongata]|uniref:Major Facilitator Superfamily protein n=1 Tax=Bryocella elongata TaxID=863522 RepID=A0A1H5UXR1_9BACT|nr:MFS transporter [Bryocella elongata]SEF79208.1 Major Facilitator Superfamily protein [Bryocella elongata]